MSAKISELDRLQAVRGDTLKLLLTVLDAEGRPMDLTGCFIWCTIKRSEDDAAPLLQKKLGQGISMLNAAMGQALIIASTSETSGMPADKLLLLDVQVREADGTISTPIKQGIVFAKDVTTTTTE